MIVLTRWWRHVLSVTHCVLSCNLWTTYWGKSYFIPYTTDIVITANNQRILDSISAVASNMLVIPLSLLRFLWMLLLMIGVIWWWGLVSVNSTVRHYLIFILLCMLNGRLAINAAVSNMGRLLILHNLCELIFAKNYGGVLLLLYLQRVPDVNWRIWVGQN